MMLGMLMTSVASGRIISRWGRYRPFPVAGTAIMTFGLLRCSREYPSKHEWETSADALVLGLGMGMVMQVLILAVQNSVEYEYLGVATSGATLFRAIGGALGVALFGAIFASGLRARLGPEGMAFLPLPFRRPSGFAAGMQPEYSEAVMAALRLVFLVAAASRRWAFCWPLSARGRLRDSAPAEGLAESFSMPRDATSLEELERIVTALMAHENRWRLYADFAQRAGIDLPRRSFGCWHGWASARRATLWSLSSELKVQSRHLRSH